jgi:hypothetical protein
MDNLLSARERQFVPVFFDSQQGLLQSATEFTTLSRVLCSLFG